ncbi:MAG TPA: hypothetical protein PLO62_07050 [Candidatus Hydrogenedentes bacterium]|nr:hypothetical protein [Candidatus Hydrogenedentota bacterium]
MRHLPIIVRVVQITLQKLLCLAVAGAGALLFFMSASEIFRYASAYLPHFDNIVLQTALRYVVGAAIVVLALFATLPAWKRRRSNTISFPGAHGPIVIQLDSVEASLNRTLRGRPEVRKINVRVQPVNDNRQVRITAGVQCYTTQAGIRETSDRIGEIIKRTAVNLLGVEEVTTVELKINGIFAGGAASDTITVTNAAPAAAAATAPLPRTSTAFDASDPIRYVESDDTGATSGPGSILQFDDDEDDPRKNA